jgi:predicted nucleic acid-binding protein
MKDKVFIDTNIFVYAFLDTNGHLEILPKIICSITNGRKTAREISIFLVFALA